MTTSWVGSEEHKRLFCSVFLDTHVAFEPNAICWPEFDPVSLARLRALPIWDEAVRTETATALEVQTLGQTERDPLLARAIALQGYEEGRHASLLAPLTRHHGIEVAPFRPPAAPKDPVWAFVSTGYGECLDSFFAFGIFAIGERSGYFPRAFTEIFDPILQEEARHIVFIVNWAVYLRARRSPALRPALDLRRAWTIARQLADHARQAVRFGSSDSQEGFTMASHSAFGDVSARFFLELCLAENDRSLAPYDSRLLRPALVAPLVRLALKVLPGRSAPLRKERADPTRAA